MRTYSLANLSLLVATTCLVIVTMPALARAQRVSSALGVAATILPPDASQPPQLVSVSVAHTGVARLETAAPVAGAVSQIVMVTLSSPTNSFAPIVQAPALVTPARVTEQLGAAAVSDALRAQRLAYEVDVGRPPADSTEHAVSVRITYLIVPGT